jgi:hypothetical protein
MSSVGLVHAALFEVDREIERIKSPNDARICLAKLGIISGYFRQSDPYGRYEYLAERCMRHMRTCLGNQTEYKM